MSGVVEDRTAARLSARGWGAALLAGVALGSANSLSSALGSPYTEIALLPEQGVRPLEHLAAWLGTRWAWRLRIGVGRQDIR